MEGWPGSGQIGILGPVELTGEEPVPLGGVKYPLEAAHDAIHDLRRGRVRGRAILIPSC